MGRVIPLHVVKWAAKEVERQQDTPVFVIGMINAWLYAFSLDPQMITLYDLKVLGSLVKMGPVRDSFRTTNVHFGNFIGDAAKPEHIHRLLSQLLDNQKTLTASEFAWHYLKIHPEEDGNGRVGAILYNVLNGTLSQPVVLPEFSFMPGAIPGELKVDDE